MKCIVAIKRFAVKGRRRAFMREEFLRERENLAEISKRRHDHILGMLASFETKSDKFNTLNIVLPFASGGNLYNFLRLESDTRWEQQGYPTSKPLLRGCLRDWRYAVYREAIGLVDALAELHKDTNGKFMMHCDIKPANILIHKRTFKLADFGLSRLKDSDETSKTTWYLGTALYSPPEHETLMGRGRDVWALGCVLLEICFMIRYTFQNSLVFLDHPDYPDIRNSIDHFEARRKKDSKKGGGKETAIYHRNMGCVLENIRMFNYMRPGLRRMITVDGLMPIIKKMLEEDPEKRLTASTAAEKLNTHYLRLQDDPQLWQDIMWRDNPCGPPWNSLGWWGEPADTANATRTVSTNLRGERPHRPGDPYPRPSFTQRTSSSFESTGATPQLHGQAPHERKRPSSVEERSSEKRLRESVVDTVDYNLDKYRLPGGRTD